MQYTNSQILAAVLNKWAQPVVAQLAQEKFSSLPAINAIDNKVRSMGWVSPNWSIARELSPMIEPITRSITQPFLSRYLSSIPDEAIPAMAHSIVDKALENKELVLLDGRIVLEMADLEELKKLLNYNLPMNQTEGYTVVTSASDAK